MSSRRAALPERGGNDVIFQRVQSLSNLVHVPHQFRFRCGVRDGFQKLSLVRHGVERRVLEADQLSRSVSLCEYMPNDVILARVSPARATGLCLDALSSAARSFSRRTARPLGLMA